MRRLQVLVLCAIAMLTSCVDDQISAVLASAEKSMDDNPKSSLEALESLDSQTLKTCKQKAKYALLYSMALDKNYIDVTNDSIIAPAIAYYKNHGSSDDKLKVNYYWGRIAMNAGEYENAISRFIIAEQYADKTSDKIAVGRLYKALLENFPRLSFSSPLKRKRYQ